MQEETNGNNRILIPKSSSNTNKGNNKTPHQNPKHKEQSKSSFIF